jgi:hypothetical protein
MHFCAGTKYKDGVKPKKELEHFIEFRFTKETFPEMKSSLFVSLLPAVAPIAARVLGSIPLPYSNHHLTFEFSAKANWRPFARGCWAKRGLRSTKPI